MHENDLAILLLFGFFAFIGIAAYVGSTKTPEQICAERVFQSDFCKTVAEKMVNGPRK